MRTFFSTLFALAGLLPLAALADGPTFAQYSLTRTASDAAGSDEFGVAVAMEGDTLAVGSHLNDDTTGNSGSVYIFRRNQGGANNWGQAKRLNASDPGNADEFGFSVDVDGDFVIVGAPFNDDQGNASGSAYIFARNQGGADQWGQVAKLTNTTGAADDLFGFDVAIDGDIAVVGSPQDDDKGSQSGAAQIFSRNQGGTDKWGQVTTITASDGGGSDRFGHAVDIDSTTIVVGARDDSTTGSMYIFQLSGTWSQVRKKQATGASGFADFGNAVAILGDRVVVGAPLDNSSRGSAFIFERNSGGANQWGQVKELGADDAAAFDEFGNSVALNGTVVMVGAWQDNSDAGSAYLFDQNAGGTGNWGQSAKVQSNNASSSDEFGTAVALIADRAGAGAPFEDLAGSNAGAAYIYTLTFNRPPVVNNQTFSIAENSPNTTVVGTIIASDPDGGQTRTFSIQTDPSAGAFSLHPTTGVLTVLNSSKLNFEVNPQFVLTVQVTDNGTPPLNDTASITINITDVAEDLDLVLTKTGPATAVAGTAMNYTLVVSNAGPTTATGVIVSDQLPAGVTPTGTQNFNVGTLVAGAASTINIPVTVNANTTGSLINNATATNNVPDLNPANNAASATTTVSAQANLAVNLTTPTNAVAGTALDLTIQVSNAGPSQAQSIIVSTTLSPGVLPTGTIMTNLGILAAGGSTSFVFTVAVKPETLGNITNLVSVSSAATDPTPGNNSDSEVVHVTAEANIAVTKTAPATAFQGSNLVYSISVANLGPSLALDVRSIDFPPFGVTPSSPIQTVHGNLAPGAVTNFTLNFTVTASGGTINNIVQAASFGNTPDPIGSNNVDNASTMIIGPADLRTVKSAPATLSDTSNLVYTIVVDNIGSGVASNATLVDTLPSGVSFDPGGSDPGCTESNGVVTCPLGTLGASGSATVTVSVVVGTNTIGVITNSATASTPSTETVLGNNTGTAQTDIIDTDGDLDPDWHDPDDDNDRMPDIWELQFGLNPTNAADAAVSADADPYTNLEEYIADTNPTNAQSFLRFDAFDAPFPVLGFQSSTGRLYTIESLNELPPQNWLPVPGLSNFPGVGGADSRTNVVITPQIHYRLKVRLP